jgi:hypothetical protein
MTLSSMRRIVLQNESSILSVTSERTVAIEVGRQHKHPL